MVISQTEQLLSRKDSNRCQPESGDDMLVHFFIRVIFVLNTTRNQYYLTLFNIMQTIFILPVKKIYKHLSNLKYGQLMSYDIYRITY